MNNYQYFMSDGKEQKGTFSFDELIKLPLTREMLVWRDGLTEWVSAEHLEDFKEYFKMTPPPLVIKEKAPMPPPLPKQETIKPIAEVPIKIEALPIQETIKPIAEVPIKTEPLPIQKTIKPIADAPIKTEPLPKQENKTQPPKTNNNAPKKILLLVGSAMLATVATLVILSACGVFDRGTDSYYSPSSASTSAYTNSTPPPSHGAISRKEEVRRNINTYLKVDINYYYREIGGISDVVVTVTNNSEFDITNVAVGVNYIRRDGNIHKTENAYIPNIPAYSSRKVSAPNSNRGIQCSTFLIEAHL